MLAAAAELFASKGVDRVTVDEIAARAGVGVGTLYRGFGDKGGLVAAILDERERELQDELLSGPPPLGPGAPAAQRIRAFLDALSRMVERSYELLVVSENNVPGARYRIGSYAAWRLHLATLLREVGRERETATTTRRPTPTPAYSPMHCWPHSRRICTATNAANLGSAPSGSGTPSSDSQTV